MKKLSVGLVSVLAVLSFGLLLVACGSSGDDGCTSNADCGTGQKCNLVTKKCVTDTCPTQCGTRLCGPTPATCDDAALTCGTCTGTNVCDTNAGTCGPCPNQCGSRQCGPTPATCDAASATCGTCTSGTCNTTTGMCSTGSHTGADQPCKCETAQACSIPCPTAVGSATTCITTDVSGNGFCSFACSAAGADAECTGDFANGCCEDLSDDGSGDNFCLNSDYCTGEPGNRTYLQTCGTEDTGNCITSLLCVGFSDSEEWGYCIYDCACPNPDNNGECPGATCTDQGLCVELSSTASTGKGGCIPPGDQAMEAFCHVPDNGCSGDMICINYGELATSGNGMCTSICDHATGSPCVDPMDCILPLVNDKWSCSRACPSHNKSECPNGGTGWQCFDIGEQGSPNYICIPE